MPPSSMNKLPAQRAFDEYLDNCKRAGDRFYKQALANGETRKAQMVQHAIEQLVGEKRNPQFMTALVRMKHVPVLIDEFIESREFLGDQIDEVWPALVNDLHNMNPDVMCGIPPVHEALLGGATGTGKTTLSTITNLYQVYLLTCFEEPQRLFGLMPVTPIVFMFQSVSTTVTRRVIYKPFRDIFLSMPYMQKYVGFDKNKESTLDLEGNIVVAPALASVQSMVGQAIIGGILDEVNFMSIVESSKLVPGKHGTGGKYDQAEETYRTISRRRKSRFNTKGPSFGCLCMISSTRYKGDFLDRRIDEVHKFEETNIVTFRRKQYEVQPAARYSGEKFSVLIGSDRWQTRVLPDDAQEDIDYPKGATIEMVPVEYRVDFLRDPENALRDIMGIATDSITSFFGQRHKIIDGIMRGRERGLVQWCDRADVDLVEHGMPQWNEEVLREVRDPDVPRWVHIDLSLTNDSCGIAVVKVAGYTNYRDEKTDTVETLPHFVVEAAVSIKPSGVRELDIGEVRGWIMQLSTFYGLNIFEITYDGFQSRESIQVLQRSGVRSAVVSMDKTTEPYEYLRRTFYQDRIDVVDSDTLRVELVQLEKIIKNSRARVDHPPAGSKDIADAVCGAVYAASTSRVIRQHTGFQGTDGSQHVRPNARPSGYSRPRGRSHL